MKNIKFHPIVFAFALVGTLTGFSTSLQAQLNDKNSKSQLPSPRLPSFSPVKYLGFAAYRLSDGRSEAVVVPRLGRVMRYAMVGGENLLWNSVPGETKKVLGSVKLPPRSVEFVMM